LADSKIFTRANALFFKCSYLCSAAAFRYFGLLALNSKPGHVLEFFLKGESTFRFYFADFLNGLGSSPLSMAAPATFSTQKQLLHS
jgi:hypothetical protein